MSYELRRNILSLNFRSTKAYQRYQFNGELDLDEEGFQKFLKRGGRKPHTIEKVTRVLRNFEAYLERFAMEKNLDNATPNDIEDYVQWYEQEEEKSAKSQLWAIAYYYRFTGNRELTTRIYQLREAQTAKTRKQFRLRDFRGINVEHTTKLEAIGIRDVEQMRKQGATPVQRREISKRTEIPEEAILEFVKLSDLARLPGVKGIRARLYYDAGVDTLEKMANWNPEELRLMLIKYVEETGFDGMAPLPKEAANSVKIAGELPKIIEI